jgi:2-methylisocitrate lyase-like PEP mutase family enzyme
MTAAMLRDLHVPGRPVVLPNVWDAGSAKVFAGAGFRALATSSSAVAESLGYADGEQTPPDEMFAALARICRTAGVPVTADIEAGYGLSPAGIAERLLAAGAAGCNLEDSEPATGVLRDPAEQAEWLAAVRAAAGDALVLNARVDVFLAPRHAASVASEEGSAVAHGSPDAAELVMADAVNRAKAYLAAGADCVYPILAPPDALAEFVRAVDGPVNALHLPNRPSLSELADLGVARITFGGGLYRRTTEFVRTLATDLHP